jgi:hypothetical protein
MIVAESLGGGSNEGSGEDGCDAESEYTAILLSNCRMGPSRSSLSPPPLPGNLVARSAVGAAAYTWWAGQAGTGS